MPPPGDRQSAPSKDRDRQGAANVGAGNRSSGPAAAKDKGGKSSGPSAARGAAAAPEKEKGIFGGIRDFFSGGAKAKSGPTAADRPKARPDVVKTGSGKDMRYMDTRTGQSYAAPDYGPFSFRGLTSDDPANVARNRYGAERAMAAQAERDRRDGPDRTERGLGSLVPLPEVWTKPAPTPAELAALGAPTVPLGPVVVEPPIYGVGMPIDGQGMFGYGSAYAAAPPFSPVDLIDLFGSYPTFGR